MKKKLVFILLFCSTIQSQAQLLWKVSGNNLEKASYIFGTHHAATASICDSIAGFQEAFNSCSQYMGNSNWKIYQP